MRFIKTRHSKIRVVGLVFALVLFLQAALPFIIPRASAGTLTNTLVRFNRMAQAQPTTGTVCAKPATTATEASVVVAFPTGFTLGSSANFTVDTTVTTGWPATATAWLGINTATNVASQNVTFPSTDLVVGTLYCFNWTNTAAVQTGTAGNYTGTVTTQTSVPAAIDTGTYALTTVGANADQITVSATVTPSFSITLSANTDALGTLTTGSVSTSPTPRTATVNTNATNGWYVWGQDSNAGIRSTIASHTIASNCSAGAGSNTTLSAGTEGYNLGVAATSQAGGSGTVTIPAVFTGGSLGRGGGLCSTNSQTIASSNGTAATSVLTLNNNAAIAGTTNPATDYTDIETFVGAGLF